MISGDVLKYRNGFLIRERYETAISDSSEFLLTLPEGEVRRGDWLMIDADPEIVFGPNPATK